MSPSAPGIVERHQRRCASRTGAKCDCKPTFEAWAFDSKTGKKVYRRFPTKSAARSWRQDAVVQLRRGEITSASTVVTVAAAVDEWVEAARKGTVRTRGRKPFAPSTVRSVEQNARLRVVPKFGSRRLDRVTLLDVQEWVDELDAKEVHPATIETSVLPLRLVYRRAKTKGQVVVDPTDGLELPGKPAQTIARTPPDPKLLFALIDATPAGDRAAWAPMMLTGVRRGELLALRWGDVDLEGGTLRVERSYDPAEGAFRPPKSGRGVRTIPLGPALGTYLREHRLRTGRRDPADLLFGDRPTRPISTSDLQSRADKAWETAKLDRVTPHTCRHLYASLMAAAGVPLHALSRYMGHGSIATTMNVYAHLFAGEEASAAAMQEAFLATAAASRLSAVNDG